MALSLREVEQSIRAAVFSRTSEGDAAALDAVQSFVSQRPADVPQLENTLLEVYNTKPANEFLDLFVEMLYIMRDHLTIDSIGRVWWDMVLQPAMRRYHMSRSCIKHATAVTIIAMREGGGVFRKRLVQLFILGVPSLNSTEEAIDNASMNAEETAQMDRWKSSLIDILTEDATKHPAVSAVLGRGIRHSYKYSSSSRKSIINLSPLKQGFH